MQREQTRRWSLVLTALLAVGCTRVSDRSRFEPIDLPLEILTSSPRPGALGVSPRVRVDLCMSGRVDPRSLDEVDATVSSGGALVDSELSVQLVPWLAPGLDLPADDTGLPWCEGSVVSVMPGTALQPGALYRTRLRPRAIGWAGESISTEGPLWIDEGDDDPRYILEFTVDPDPPSQPRPPTVEVEPTTLNDLFEGGGPFDPARELCSCHRDPDALALARLDLREPAAAFADLLGSSDLRDTGFPMVVPRDPSQSFLVQKLLRTDQGDALHGVRGDPMPPDEPIDYADQLAIVEWIVDGAEP